MAPLAERRRRGGTFAASAAALAIAALIGGCRTAGVGGGPLGASALRSPDLVLRDTPAPAIFRVRFETSRGVFVAEAHRDWAPIGADRFYALVRHRFFDDQRFFRVRAGFIAQFGLHGDPAVIAAWKGRVMPDDRRLVENRRGTLAYAFTTAGTRSTQILINLADNVALDEQGFAPFARIVEGIEVIDRLYAAYDERAGGGMRGGNQGRIEAEGNAHLLREFPRLDYIVRARLVEGRMDDGRWRMEDGRRTAECRMHNAECRIVIRRRSSIVHPPSSILHRPSSIVHPPSSILPPCRRSAPTRSFTW